MLKILKEEMMLAQGCTEPIAAAYTASVATRLLNSEVSKMKVIASMNIVKNAKGVVIPGTKDICGIIPSAIFGVLCGDHHLEMEVLSNLSFDDSIKCTELLTTNFCTLEVVDSAAKLYIEVIVYDKNNNSASAKVIHQHTNIVETTLNGRVMSFKAFELDQNKTQIREDFTIDKIYDYVNYIDTDVLGIIKDQISYNKLIADEGSTKRYALGVFQNNFKETGEMNLEFDIRRKAAAMAAAGSDARMSGCTLPVMTLNGSGNQGIAASIPVIVYAEFLNSSYDKLIRAVTLSDLIAIRIKEGIGRLSPMCGVIPACIGSVAGIMYLYDYNLEQIKAMIQNTVANNTGIICDGAKPSCALKIYSAIDAALLSAQLAVNKTMVLPFTGIVDKDVEKTIDNLGIISQAMDKIDGQIIKIMTDKI